MTNLPTPKFSIGDKVWVGDWTTETTWEACPECQGTQFWTCKTPAGNTVLIRCPDCDTWDRRGLTRVYRNVPTAVQLTIGSVRINTSDENPISYMCEETGVGSGSVWDEERLSFSVEEAMQVGAEKLAVHVAEVEKRNKETLERKRRRVRRKEVKK